MACARTVLVVLSLAVQLITASVIPPIPEQERKFYELDTAKLQDLWHTAMVRGLIKTYTKPLLELLPRTEKLVYGVCIRDAATTVALAKCAARVFNMRDNILQQAEIRNRTTSLPPPISVERKLGRRRFNRKKLSITKLPKPSKLSKLADYEKYLHKSKKKTRFSQKHKKRRRSKRAAKLEGGKQAIITHALEKSIGAGKKTSKSAIEAKLEGLQMRPAMNIGKIASKYLRKLLLGKKVSSHLENLRVISEHYRRVDECNRFFQRMNEQNRKFFKEFNLGIDSRTPEVENNADPVMQSVLNIVNAFAASTSTEKFSIMSPRLLSILPSQQPKKHLLSPTLLSFQKDGFLSLPELFDMATMNKRQQNMFLDVIMDLSGAGKTVEEMMIKLKPEMDDVKYVKLPLVQELARRHDRWMRSRAYFTDEQRNDYEQKGYAFMDKNQLKLIYNSQEQLLSNINVTELSMLSKEEKMQRIERDIRGLAELDQPKAPSWGNARYRRQAEQEEEQELEETSEERINGVLFQTLEPFAFESEVGFGGALEVVTLSPHAFIPEIVFPRALRQETLSPRAFIAAILSPNALIARILSPTAFRVEVLSPRALHAWVLSPEALIAEVLSPKFLDPRVLSPLALVVEVLSPSNDCPTYPPPAPTQKCDIITPYVGSPEYVTVLVLSPHVLSPRVESQEKMVVEVMSPHILGGAHSHEEAFHQVSEFGAHSPHYHGDEAHEREENTHHSHELGEGELERIPGIPSFGSIGSLYPLLHGDSERENEGHGHNTQGHGHGFERGQPRAPSEATLLGLPSVGRDPLSNLLAGYLSEEHHGQHTKHPETNIFGLPSTDPLSALLGVGRAHHGLAPHTHPHGDYPEHKHSDAGGIQGPTGLTDIDSFFSSLLGHTGEHGHGHGHGRKHEEESEEKMSIPGLPFVHIINPLR